MPVRRLTMEEDPIQPPSVAASPHHVSGSPRARAHAAAVGIDFATIVLSGDRISKPDVVLAAGAAPQHVPGARPTPPARAWLLNWSLGLPVDVYY